MTEPGSGSICKFFLLRNGSPPPGKVVTATGLTALMEKTGDAKKLTGGKTLQYSEEYSPLRQSSETLCIAPDRTSQQMAKHAVES